MLRANPDGEGNWSHEARPDVVHEVRSRAKGGWSPQFAMQVSKDIASRHLPLLVDAGGKPSDETALIATQCTHAILIAANPADLDPWRTLVSERGLPLLAEIHSVLEGPQRITQERPTMYGVISGLSRDQSSDGPCFSLLAERLKMICAYGPEELYNIHLAMTSTDMVIHLEQPIYPLPAHTSNTLWRPEEIPVLLKSIPVGEPLGIYGRGPAWVYGALAVLASPAPCTIFDVRSGWVTPPLLTRTTGDPAPFLRWNPIIERFHYTHIQFILPEQYLSYQDIADVVVPNIPEDRGVLLDGKLPLWLWSALARTYANHAWVAIYQPQLAGAVVICSQSGAVPVGSVVPVTGGNGREHQLP